MNYSLNSDPRRIIQKSNDPERGHYKLVFSQLPTKHTSSLKQFGLLGMISMDDSLSLVHFADSIENIEPVNKPTTVILENDVPTETVEIYTNSSVASSVNDNMSFKEAFSSARNEIGTGGVFEWRGDLYNTFTKEEWLGLSYSDKEEFSDLFNDIEYNSFAQPSDSQLSIASEDAIQIFDGEYEYTLTEKDIHLNASTANQTNDIFLVDINDNGALDLILDHNGDQIMDDLILDFIPGTDETVIISETSHTEKIEIIDNIDYDEEQWDNSYDNDLDISNEESIIDDFEIGEA